MNFDDGVNQTNLSNNAIQNCPLTFPKDEDEQKRIAEALSDTDALIASLKKQIEKDRRIKTALMRHHFFDPNKQNGRYCPLGEYAKIYQSETISSSDMTSFGFPVYCQWSNWFLSQYNHEDWQITITCRFYLWHSR